jgi:hypothetical protein
MTELKTLKDFGSDSFCACGLRLGEPCKICDNTFKFNPKAKVFTEMELKAEAIKWVKYMEKSEQNWGDTISQFMSFFDLTEDDLKEGERK